MDRRIGRIVLVLAALGACSRREDPRRVGAHPGTRSVADPPADAASIEIDAEPIWPSDVLTGEAAERALAEKALLRGADEVAEDELGAGPAYRILPTSVGRFRLGMPRAGVVARLAGLGRLRRVPRPKGQPLDLTVEEASVPGLTGAPLFTLRLAWGRLVEITVLSRDRRALTAEGIQVGSSFRDAIDAHGEARQLRGGPADAALGWVLQDLPGVVLVPADRRALAAELPPPDGVIGRLRVIGPEATAVE